MKKFFVMLLAAAMCLGVAAMAQAAITAEQPAGNGTQANPYKIGTAEELQWYGDAVNNGSNDIYGELTQNIDLNPGVSFRFILDTGLVEVTKSGSVICYLGSGINGDGSGSNSTFDTTASTAGAVYNAADSTTSSTEIPAQLNLWKPIGDYNDNYAGNGVEYEFTGHFDGKGYAVSGVFSNEYQYSGLFGIMGNNNDDDCSIQNVNVSNSYISNQTQYTGSILGALKKGTLTDCSSNALICAANNAGGVVGSASTGTVIERCSFSGTLYSRKSSTGGICGYLSSGEIRNCYNEGNIINSCTDINSPVGGICGTSQGTSASAYASITGCYNTGNVTAQKRQVGGIVGMNSIYAIVNQCYNTGNVTADSRVGGICGYNNGISIEDCYNVGRVTASKEAGGICGYLNQGRISNSHNYANISGTNVGAVCGENQAGNNAVTNTHYLEGTASKGVGNKNDAAGYAESKADTVFKNTELVNLLNAERIDAVWTQGKDYPVLKGVGPLYNVTMPQNPVGYTITPVNGSSSPVSAGSSYSFELHITDGYQKGDSFAVKVNGSVLSESDDDNQYIISNIHENQNITVEGVEAATASEEGTLPGGENSGPQTIVIVTQDVTAPVDTEIPQTGDKAQVERWCAFFLLALTGLGLTSRMKRSKRKNER